MEKNMGIITINTQKPTNGSCCFQIGNSCIVITAAHAIMKNDERKAWDDPLIH